VSIGEVSRAALQDIAAVAVTVWPEPWSSVLRLTLENDRLFAAAIYEYVPSKLVSDRIVLVGDAGHVASPITGSGARFALQDARQLGLSLQGRSVSEGLADFEQQRLSVSRQLVLQGSAWGQRFVSESAA